MICPVCNKFNETECDYMGGILLEEHFQCSCGYRYDYAHGSTEESFGEFEFWSVYTGIRGSNTFLPYQLALYLYRMWCVMSRTAFLPFGFTVSVIIAPFYALTVGIPIVSQVLITSLLCVTVLFGNIIYQLVKE